jgi:hypothetical protein
MAKNKNATDTEALTKGNWIKTGQEKKMRAIAPLFYFTS